MTDENRWRLGRTDGQPSYRRRIGKSDRSSSAEAGAGQAPLCPADAFSHENLCSITLQYNELSMGQQPPEALWMRGSIDSLSLNIEN